VVVRHRERERERGIGEKKGKREWEKGGDERGRG